jgi:uncharacterized lipoprotein YddW (UPF0748 family)
MFVPIYSPSGQYDLFAWRFFMRQSISALFVLVFTVFSYLGCASDSHIFDKKNRAERIAESTFREDVFGLWVTRWDFRTTDDIQRVVNDAADLGVTDLYWQVRGQGDAFYRSELEPWGEELTQEYDKAGKAIDDRNRDLDPGFDPLLFAINEAHHRGLRIHAWINVMPHWKGVKPPIDAKHSFYTRPHWRLSDENSKPQELSSGYVVVNPVLDEVQDHIVAVVSDIVHRYQIDGVHLDYVRFLNDELDSEKLYPGDARSLSLYAREVGDRATAGQVNRTKYRDWIRSRITRLVERISNESLLNHPEVRYSAAVWRRPDLARKEYLQDAASWIDEGVVDEIMPMIYTLDDAQFQDDLESWYRVADRKRVIAGIGAYKHDLGSQTLSQATLGHPRRFVLFAYSSIFESSNPGQEKLPERVRAREHKREALAQFIERVGN